MLVRQDSYNEKNISQRNFVCDIVWNFLKDFIFIQVTELRVENVPKSTQPPTLSTFEHITDMKKMVLQKTLMPVIERDQKNSTSLATLIV